MNDFKSIKTIHWRNRLSGSFKAIGFGFLMIIGAVIILWVNEGRAVKTTRGLKEGQEKVVEVNPNKIRLENNNQLVHFYSKVETSDTLIDNVFNLKVNALKLNRFVEVFQWEEKDSTVTQKNMGGSETQTTIYTYYANWFDDLINSNDFKDSTKQNPQHITYQNKTYIATPIKMGAYTLPSDYVEDIIETEPIDLSSLQLDTAKFNTSSISQNYIYIGKGTLEHPQVGDLRVSFYQTKPNEVYSVLAMQHQQTLSSFITTEGTTINVFTKGKHLANEMFETQHSKNTFLTWMLRIGGLVLMFLGFKKIMELFVVLADVVPILGSVLNFGTSIIAGVLAFVLSFLIVAIAWFAYRPMVSLIFFSISVLSFGTMYYLMYVKKK